MHFKIHVHRVLLFFLLVSVFPIHAQDVSVLTPNSLDSLWSNRESEDGQTRIIHLMQDEPPVPQDFDAAWRVARLVYFIGNFGIGEHLSKAERVKLFQYGYKAGEIAKNNSPGRVEGYYWYAIDLGAYSLSNGVLSSLRNAREGRDALLQAVKLDPSYHWAGPYRILGRYYQELPAVISFGDKEKADFYFDQAIKTAPEFALNKVYRARLFVQMGEKKNALSLLQEAQKMPALDGKLEEERYKRERDQDILRLERN